MKKTYQAPKLRIFNVQFGTYFAASPCSLEIDNDVQKGMTGGDSWVKNKDGWGRSAWGEWDETTWGNNEK